MSKMLKGFVEIQALQSAMPGVISELGELSIWSLTFTKDKNEFGDPDIKGYQLVSTNYKDTTGDTTSPSVILVNQVIAIVQTAVAYAELHPMPLDAADLRATLSADFTAGVTSLKTGPLVSNGYIQLPEWIEWTSIAEAGAAVKIWLSDAAFSNQYDLFEITVIPPLENVDDFFQTPATVRAQLAAITPSQMMDGIQAAKNHNPETYIRTEGFNYVSPIAGEAPVRSDWSVLIYGIQGDNIDAIKDAIIAYVLAHSTHTQAEWEVLIPDLFKRTEFVILPRWDKIAIPDMAAQTGLYGSMTKPAGIGAFVSGQVTFYPASWVVEQNITVLPFPYKCLTLNAIAGPTNEGDAADLQTLFPDYLPLPSTSLDFNRMVAKTQGWLLLMEKMLIVAEDLSAYTTLPESIHLVYRDNVAYLSAFYNNVNFLVALKA